MNCLECGKLLSGDKRKKFCSRSCSAKYNNRSRVKFTCLGCGSPTHSANRDYCTSDCKQAHLERLWFAGEIDGNGTYSYKSFVRKYLSHRSNESCELCDFDTRHPDGNSILQVDHIDGDWENCRPENLRLLCPNCHYLTPNHGARNMGNGRKWKEKYKQF